jgi:hypothetical protein
MLTRSRALGLGVGSILLCGLGARALPGCGGSDTSGLGPIEDGGDTGGDGSDTGDGGSCSYATSFVLPADGAKLGVADDKSGMKCSGGLITDVTVATSAPDGTPGKLFANDTRVGTATAAGAKLIFSGIALPSKGPVVLRVSVADSDCGSENVTIDCGVPSCSISAPKGPYLNGRTTADGGDRVNNPTDPFATAFVVDTDLADGEFVSLTTDGSATQKVAASGGKATFSSVSMSPDGKHNAKATCTNTAGNVGSSGLVEYDVLTETVDLALTQPTNGKSFGLVDDVDAATAGIQFDLCGTTGTAAAIDVPADARGGQKNLCAAIGTATGNCVSMTKATSGSGGAACVRVTCPSGNAPFDVNVTLADKAGNQATAKRTGLRCESSLPSVSVVSPVAYVASTPATILNLAAGEMGTVSGALKKTIVACTDKNPAKAAFFAGRAGGTLTSLGAPVDVVAATAADGCPTALGYVARFAATLPESLESTDGKGTLATATEIRVDVTDSGTNVGSSPKVDLWVDSIPPSISLLDPSCGKVYNGTTDVTASVKLSSDTLPLTFKVTGSATTGTYPVAAFDTPSTALPGLVTIPNVKFYIGGSSLTLQATDAAGNPAPGLSSCKTYVGSPPVVTISTPTSSAMFGADANVDAATHKYRTNVTGTIGGTTTATTVSLKVAGTVLVTAPIAGSAYTFSNVLLPESDALALSVELTDANYGVIAQSVTVVVDTHLPSQAGALSAAEDPATRRAGGFALGWSAGTDYDPVSGGSRACDHYEVRRAAATLGSEAAWTAATLVSSSVSKSLTATTVTTGRIPSTYFFAIRCVDKVGNLSPIVATSAAATADFITNQLSAPSGVSGFGKEVSGSLDLDGDPGAIPDLVVGSTSGKATVYFGHRPTARTDSGYSATPDLALTGSGFFGYSVAEIGDFDGDGHNDIIVGAPVDNKAWVISGTAIVAGASDVGVASLGSKVLTLVGDGTASLFGLPVRSASGFFSSSIKGAVYVRGRFGTIQGLAVVKSRPISGGTLILPAAADFYVTAAGNPSGLGNTAAFQDVDGDGLTDLFTGDSDASSVYLFNGRATSSATPVLPSAATASLTSTTPGDFFGFAVGLPGKITGSRFDAVVGAFKGAGRADVVSLAGTPTLAGSMTTTTAGSELGYSTLLNLPGQTFDLDKDGFGDVLVCTYTATASGSACYLSYGAAPFASVDVAAARRIFSVDSSSGVTAHSIGDIDGDGFVDFALCSPGAGYCTLVR